MEIIKSDSRFRLCWDILILLLILFSSVIIPYQIAFQHEINTIGSILIYFIDLIFIGDIILHFFFSYRSKGDEIFDKSKIASNYYRSFFLLDLVSNVPFDLLYLLLIGMNSGSGVSIILLLRSFRLLRLSRLFRIFENWKSHHWINPGILRINRLVITIVILIHIIACVWFFIAFVKGPYQESWVVLEGLAKSSEYEQYIRSLYWTITTMTTVGYGDITPTLPEEYIMSMIVMLIGASLYAFIIGNIASLFSNIDARKTEYWSNIESVTRYFNFRNVPKKVVNQVRDYYEYMWAQKRGLRDDNLLNDLPEPLQLELLNHLAKDLLLTVPLFKYSTPYLKNVLLRFLKNESYPPDVEIAREGELGNAIYFISRGSAVVVSRESQKVHCELEAGEYFGDLSMLLKEKRTACVKTTSYCELFILSNEDFVSIKESCTEFKNVMAKMSTEKSEKMAALLMDGIVL